MILVCVYIYIYIYIYIHTHTHKGHSMKKSNLSIYRGHCRNKGDFLTKEGSIIYTRGIYLFLTKEGLIRVIE